MHCAWTFDQHNTNCSTRIHCTYSQRKVPRANPGANFRSWHCGLRMDAGGLPAAVGHDLCFWDSGLIAKTLRCHHPSTPNIQVVNLQSTQPTISKTVPQIPTFACWLEDKLMTLGTHQKNTGGQHIHGQTVCWEHNAQGWTKRAKETGEKHSERQNKIGAVTWGI